MTPPPQARAQRYGVSWPVRVRTPASGQWSTGRSVNLSISGVLVDVPRHWRIGEVLELELEFLSTGPGQTVGAIGRVTRTDGEGFRRAAIQFDLAHAEGFVALAREARLRAGTNG